MNSAYPFNTKSLLKFQTGGVRAELNHERVDRMPCRNSFAGALVAGLGFSLAACSGGGGSDSSTSGLPQSANLTPQVNPITKEVASRYLVQTSFGPTVEAIDDVSELGLETWFLLELQQPTTLYLPDIQLALFLEQEVPRQAATDAFWDAAAGGSDQLRQRMMYALSQIFVVSMQNPTLNNQPQTTAHYMDILSRNAFGNFRDILQEVTYSPAMATYLTYFRNRKADMNTGRVPDENYAREIMQLFTIGLVELNPDGTPRAGGIETYDNLDVQELAKVFTGISHAGGFWSRDRLDDWSYTNLVMYDEHHSPEQKSFLGLTIPPDTDGETSVNMALDHLFNHPNVGPFFGRQLIQRFVTSNPSPAYVGRVTEAFNTGTYELPSGNLVGERRRGDLTATLAAVIFDEEARQDTDTADREFGKVREPALRFLHWTRAFDMARIEASEESYLSDTSALDRLGQQPFRSPSVFNFYRPQYVAPASTTGEAGLNAPELQIVNETSTVGYINFISRFIRDDTPNRNDGDGSSFSPQYTRELALADDPAALADHLNELMLYGTMHQDTRDRMIALLNEITIEGDDQDEDRLTRVENAVLMVMTAPEYLVQR